MNAEIAKENAETLATAKELGELARLEISDGPGDDPANECSAARDQRGRAFTVDDLPTLPLPGCAAAVCGCTYVLLLPDEP